MFQLFKNIMSENLPRNWKNVREERDTVGAEIDRCALLLGVEPTRIRPLKGVTLKGESNEHYSVVDLIKAFNDNLEKLRDV